MQSSLGQWRRRYAMKQARAPGAAAQNGCAAVEAQLFEKNDKIRCQRLGC
jgi:hypothetical protein